MDNIDNELLGLEWAVATTAKPTCEHPTNGQAIPPPYDSVASRLRKVAERQRRAGIDLIKSADSLEEQANRIESLLPREHEASLLDALEMVRSAERDSRTVIWKQLRSATEEVIR